MTQAKEKNMLRKISAIVGDFERHQQMLPSAGLGSLNLSNYYVLLLMGMKIK